MFRDLVHDLDQIPVIDLTVLDDIQDADDCSLFGGVSLSLVQLETIAVISESADRFRYLIGYLKDMATEVIHETNFV